MRLLRLAPVLLPIVVLGLPAAASADTATFTRIGQSTFVVPAGVTSVRVDAVGGKGGAGGPNSSGSAGSPGGFGARASTTLQVTPGATLFVEVGSNGYPGRANGGGTGTFGNGGLGGVPGAPGGGGGGAGGGASDVRLANYSGDTATSVSSRLVVAGGGGGGGGGATYNPGGDGGATPQAGRYILSSIDYIGGRPGSASAGGAAGTAFGRAGAPGVFGSGGTGGSGPADRLFAGGGGGGGGWFGGGGGQAYEIYGSEGGIYGPGAGGGAGSSIAAAGLTTGTVVATDASGVPSVSITWTPPAGTSTKPVVTTPGGGVSVTTGRALNTFIDARPSSVVRSRKRRTTVRFEFSSNVDGASFRCKLDDRESASCRSAKRYTVSRGDHRFQVWAVKNGKKDPTPAKFSFSLVRKR